MSLINCFAFYFVIATVAANSIQSRAECGGFITGTSGELLSPNYPRHYDPLSFCDWFLTAENGGRIEIMIHDIQTESSDFVRIRDGFSMGSPLLLEFSGTATSLNSLSNGPQVYFGFSADVQQRGFNATWREV